MGFIKNPEDSMYLSFAAIIVLAFFTKDCDSSSVRVKANVKVEMHQPDSLRAVEELKMDEYIQVKDGTRVEK